MHPNSNETILLMMIENLENKIKLLQKKNYEMKKINDVLFGIIQNQKEKENGTRRNQNQKSN
jgi:hypothetical protein